MDRPTVYALAIPYETDFLSLARSVQEGLGALALDQFGTGPVVSGLACNPTSPATLAVVLSPGRIYQMAFLDALPYGQLTGITPAGGLSADTNPNHQVLKQGLLRDPQTLSCPAPGTAGTSVNYLIEAMFQEADTTPSVLQFFNTANPALPLAGPNGDGLTLPTMRACQCLIQAKAGIAAATGSQVTPAADAGWVGLYSVTVAAGQTAITGANISLVAGAPFLVQGQAASGGGSSVSSPGTYAVDTSGTANQITASLTPALTAYKTGFVFWINPANASTGPVVANINALGNVSVIKPDGSALLQNDLMAGTAFEVIVKTGPVLQMLSWPQPALDKRQPVRTANFTAAAGIFYPIDTSSGAVTVILPASPKYGDRIGFGDPIGSWQSNTVIFNGNSGLIQGSSANFLGNINNVSGEFVYRGGSYGWVWEF